MHVYFSNKYFDKYWKTHNEHCFEPYVVEGDLGMVGGGWGIWLGLGVDGGALVGDLGNLIRKH